MSDDKQIYDLKNQYKTTVYPNTRRRILDTLAVYGPKAINHINELLPLTVDPDVKAYWLDLIQKIRET